MFHFIFLFPIFSFFIVIINRTPLFFAVRRNDVKAIRLLLDFKADINITTNGISLLSVAAQYGFSEAIKMLISAGARQDVGSIPPLISVIKSGSRASLIELLKQKPREILAVYNEKPILFHAIVEKTTLLPVIAAFARDETTKMKQEGDPNTPPFPPLGLSPSQQKRLNTALERNEIVSTTTTSEYPEDQVKSIWQEIPHQEDHTIIPEDFITTETDDDIDAPFGIPDTPIQNIHREYVESSEVFDLPSDNIQRSLVSNNMNDNDHQYEEDF